MSRVEYYSDVALPLWCKLRCHNYDGTISAHLFVAEECVCVCLHEILEKEVQIHILETRKQYRRKGYASLLLDTILKSHPHKPFYLECRTLCKAQGMYAKFGFKLFAGYYGENTYSIPVLAKPVEGMSLLSLALETEKKEVLGREREKYLTNVAVWNPRKKKFEY